MIAHARSRSLKEVAALLCVPPELLEKWKEYYAGKIKIQYLPDKFIRHKEFSLFYIKPPNYKKMDKRILENCPGCGLKVVFESIKSLPVQRAQSAEIAGQHSWANADGVFPVNSPFMDITSERIERCPNCGFYVIRYVTERLANSENY